jgi:hypothetical protein
MELARAGIHRKRSTPPGADRCVRVRASQPRQMGGRDGIFCRRHFTAASRSQQGQPLALVPPVGQERPASPHGRTCCGEGGAHGGSSRNSRRLRRARPRRDRAAIPTTGASACARLSAVHFSGGSSHPRQCRQARAPRLKIPGMPSLKSFLNRLDQRGGLARQPLLNQWRILEAHAILFSQKIEG